METSCKHFYDYQYIENDYAKYQNAEEHGFFSTISMFSEKYKFNQFPCKKCLEVGSGRGLLQDIAEDYTGIDYSDSVARLYHKPFFCASATDLPFGDNEFDIIWSAYVLEHVQNVELALDEMVRVTKSGGAFIT